MDFVLFWAMLFSIFVFGLGFEGGGDFFYYFFGGEELFVLG